MTLNTDTDTAADANTHTDTAADANTKGLNTQLLLPGVSPLSPVWI